MKQLISYDELQNSIKKFADYVNKSLSSFVLLYIEDGATRYANDLLKHLDKNLVKEVMPIKIKSYTGTQSTELKWYKKPNCESLKGRVVLLIDDILDTGKTLSTVVKELLKCEPAAIIVNVLLFKQKEMMSKEETRALDYLFENVPLVNWLFQIPDEFVIGYGLDYDGEYRDLDGIYIFDKEDNNEN